MSDFTSYYDIMEKEENKILDNYTLPFKLLKSIDLELDTVSLPGGVNDITPLDHLFSNSPSYSFHKNLKEASQKYHYLINKARTNFKNKEELLFFDKLIKVLILAKLAILQHIFEKNR